MFSNLLPHTQLSLSKSFSPINKGIITFLKIWCSFLLKSYIHSEKDFTRCSPKSARYSDHRKKFSIYWFCNHKTKSSYCLIGKLSRRNCKTCRQTGRERANEMERKKLRETRIIKTMIPATTCKFSIRLPFDSFLNLNRYSRSYWLFNSKQ